LDADEDAEEVGESLSGAEVVAEGNTSEALEGENSRTKGRNQFPTKASRARKTEKPKPRPRSLRKKTSNLTAKSSEEEEGSREANSFPEDEDVGKAEEEDEGEEWKESPYPEESKPGERFTYPRSRSQVLVLSPLRKLPPLPL
jgi:hypothetical protein